MKPIPRRLIRESRSADRADRYRKTQAAEIAGLSSGGWRASRPLQRVRLGLSFSVPGPRRRPSMRFECVPGCHSGYSSSGGSLQSKEGWGEAQACAVCASISLVRGDRAQCRRRHRLGGGWPRDLPPAVSDQHPARPSVGNVPDAAQIARPGQVDIGMLHVTAPGRRHHSSMGRQVPERARRLRCGA
jgi:hypothetical protein